MKKLLLLLPTVFLLLSCTSKTKVDLLVYNATIYTVDSSFSIAEAMAVNDGKIVETGKTSDLQAKYDTKEKLDAQGKFIYPGFIDAHAHFVGYGQSLFTVDLYDSKSMQVVVQRVKDFDSAHPTESWILGRGWDQNKFPGKAYPTNEELNKLFPNKPVLLERVDGHASIANDKAIKLAGLKPGDKIPGGEIETKNGKLTGILIDNAVDLVAAKIPSQTPAKLKEALMEAQKNCFAVGLTTIDDCGLSYAAVSFIDSLQKTGDLKMRFYAMLSDAKANYDFAFQRGKIKTDGLHVCGFKIYADGALGSRGACLLQPYADKPGWSGFLLSSQQHFDSVAKIIHDHGWQMCTHAIGDSGNRTMLNVYGKYLNGKNDLRWRIEHAQVINENDFKLFGEYNIIPSVQPTHATSDMYWAGDRLGPERVKGAYAFKQLLEQNGWIPLGTDFPVEDISPFKTFYAAVVRKDAKGWPPDGFQMENALTRDETLRGMTIWAAKANFEENEKGSLEKGKFADFVILDNDLVKEVPEKLLQVKVLKTFVGGEQVYEKR
ncbi:MAG TPA: amidohydrolase [Chitinophagaceae bacterium]|nr:amidohydrolase [Chitinophagaceae bacterium]